MIQIKVFLLVTLWRDNPQVRPDIWAKYISDHGEIIDGIKYFSYKNSLQK